MIFWLMVAAVILAAIALLLRAISGPWSRINPQDHPDEDDSDGWPGV
ncbi:MAG: hypothetical protein U0836_20350 [Pirellulales bacterium]